MEDESSVSKSNQDQPAEGPALASLSWPFEGGDVGDIGREGRFVTATLGAAGPDELIARVDAVCICSSDIKIIRMGSSHALFRERDLSESPVVLGHELAVTLVDVGANWRHRYRPGQRLGLQPAVLAGSERLTVGVDLPGGLSQFIKLDPTLLDGERKPYLFDVPPDLSAAEVAMLEPYACVEAAFRPNSRVGLKEGGRLLIWGAPDASHHTLSAEVFPAEAVLIDAPPALESWARAHTRQVTVWQGEPAGDEAFDDIVLCGRHEPARIAAALRMLRKGGLLAMVAADPNPLPVDVDIARIHYHEIAVVGARGPEVDEAFGPARNRFEVKPGGTMLILGAGGAMGRIHTHRALELKDGPKRVIATSRKGSRLEALRRDFAPMAKAHGRELVVLEDAELEAALSGLGEVDDAVVVAPSVAAVERAAAMLAPGGMLVVFAGVAMGEPCRLPLSRIVSDGLRITGSTGSTVSDQLGVLERVKRGELDLTENLEAVAGFDAVPAALKAVMEGRFSGKVAIYPGILGLPLTPVSALGIGDGRHSRWTIEDERALAGK
ncbi:alcohol dehydrogenase catalytic domain-containing protein [Chelativorans sp.]|uniref:alcohol dehydrogenase catalytic domain-containing protein n=1 Tax=Chelativorans sp. TaxID=2203393 RepID=UPI002812610F|nr:alcohol dehydrogenase catalytic domain-containing protein [Chelativorans sp.]